VLEDRIGLYPVAAISLLGVEALRKVKEGLEKDIKEWQKLTSCSW
jgi:hypothetical protein